MPRLIRVECESIFEDVVKPEHREGMLQIIWLERHGLDSIRAFRGPVALRDYIRRDTVPAGPMQGLGGVHGRDARGMLILPQTRTPRCSRIYGALPTSGGL